MKCIYVYIIVKWKGGGCGKGYLPFVIFTHVLIFVSLYFILHYRFTPSTYM